MSAQEQDKYANCLASQKFIYLNKLKSLAHEAIVTPMPTVFYIL